MPDLNKVVLNKEVVQMRKSVRKAQQQLSAKLLKTLKRLKGQKLKDEDVKNSKKVDNILTEIRGLKYEGRLEINAHMPVECKQKQIARLAEKYIKKIKVDVVSKYALENTKPLSEAIRNASFKDRVIAKLADQKVMRKAVETFRQKYPYWEIQVKSLYHVWAIQKKYSMLPNWDTMDNVNMVPLGVIKRTCLKKKIVSKESSNEAGEHDKVDGGVKDMDDDSDASSDYSDASFDYSDASSDDNDASSDDGIEFERQVASSESDEDDKTDFTTGFEPVSLPNINTKAMEANVKQLHPSNDESRNNSLMKLPIEPTFKGVSGNEEGLRTEKVKSEIEVRRLNLSEYDDDEDSEIIITTRTDVSNTIDDNHNTKHRVKSSFFLDSDGKAHSDDNKPEIHNERSRLNNGQRTSGVGNRTVPLNRAARRKLLRKVNPPALEKMPSRIQKKLAILCSQEYLTKIRSKTLHPSWEAKKKVNEQKNIVEFQGKKITFDDDD